MLAVARCAVDLDELGEVHTVPENHLDGPNVRLESVAGQLIAAPGRSVGQLANKIVRRLSGALAQVVGEYQLRAALYADKTISIAYFFAVSRGLVALFLLDKTPNLIYFYVMHGEVLDLRHHQGFATLPGQHQQTHERVPVCAGNPLRAANRVAFEQQLQGKNGFVLADVHGV